MLVSKGVTKIIKKYGYLPVDYLTKEQTKKKDKMSKIPQNNMKKLLIKKFNNKKGSRSTSR